MYVCLRLENDLQLPHGRSRLAIKSKKLWSCQEIYSRPSNQTNILHDGDCMTRYSVVPSEGWECVTQRRVTALSYFSGWIQFFGRNFLLCVLHT